MLVALSDPLARTGWGDFPSVKHAGWDVKVIHATVLILGRCRG